MQTCRIYIENLLFFKCFSKFIVKCMDIYGKPDFYIHKHMKKYFLYSLIGTYCKWYNCSWLVISTIKKKNLQIRKWGGSLSVSSCVKKMFRSQLIKAGTQVRTFFRQEKWYLCIWEILTFFVPVFSCSFRKRWMRLQWSSPLPFKDTWVRGVPFAEQAPWGVYGCETSVLRLDKHKFLHV